MVDRSIVILGLLLGSLAESNEHYGGCCIPLNWRDWGRISDITGLGGDDEAELPQHGDRVLTVWRATI